MKKDCSECKHFDEFHTSRACHDCKPWKSSTDYISRADAIEAVRKCVIQDVGDWAMLVDKAEAILALNALPSADVEPTVIRSKTLMPTKDFKEWAKRVRETNPNAVVIPCDAEVVSAEAYFTDGNKIAEWIPCSERLPKEKQEVYVTVYFIEGDTGRAYGYMDGFGRWHLYSTVEGTLNSGYEVTAWMPLPPSYRGK